MTPAQDTKNRMRASLVAMLCCCTAGALIFVGRAPADEAVLSLPAEDQKEITTRGR